jgi:hypothetical protein
VGDLATFKSQIDSQSGRVVESAQAALGLLQGAWSALLEVRNANVEASLQASFDLRKFHLSTFRFSVSTNYELLLKMKLDLNPRTGALSGFILGTAAFTDQTL